MTRIPHIRKPTTPALPVNGEGEKARENCRTHAFQELCRPTCSVCIIPTLCFLYQADRDPVLKDGNCCLFPAQDRGPEGRIREANTRKYDFT